MEAERRPIAVMTEFKFPVVVLEENKFQVVVDLNIYDKEALNAALYKFTHLFYVHQMLDDVSPNKVLVMFESKDENIVSEIIPKQFCNELIDQQLRYDTNKKFGHIRDMIVKEAFKPINK